MCPIDVVRHRTRAELAANSPLCRMHVGREYVRAGDGSAGARQRKESCGADVCCPFGRCWRYVPLGLGAVRILGALLCDYGIQIFGNEASVQQIVLSYIVLCAGYYAMVAPVESAMRDDILWK